MLERAVRSTRVWYVQSLFMKQSTPFMYKYHRYCLVSVGAQSGVTSNRRSDNVADKFRNLPDELLLFVNTGRSMLRTRFSNYCHNYWFQRLWIPSVWYRTTILVKVVSALCSFIDSTRVLINRSMNVDVTDTGALRENVHFERGPYAPVLMSTNLSEFCGMVP